MQVQRICLGSIAAGCNIVELPGSFVMRDVMQILQSRQMAQWVKWVQSTNQAMAVMPNVSSFGALLPPSDQASAILPSPDCELCRACGRC
jgi:hypothetical protein